MYGNSIKNYQTCRKVGEIHLILRKSDSFLIHLYKYPPNSYKYPPNSKGWILNMFKKQHFVGTNENRQ